MNNINLNDIFDNKELLKELLIQENIEDAQKVCRKYNIDISIEELENVGKLIMKLVIDGNNLSNDQLDSVVGGTSVGKIACQIAGSAIGLYAGALAGATAMYYPAIAEKYATEALIGYPPHCYKKERAAVGFIGGGIAGSIYGYGKGGELYEKAKLWWNKN